ncbi:MAG: tetratricopeptide repeat protein [Chitinispirillaceae bacterium]|nr:tetratricopeptide repeat protein [Chitinispirillaceae bacterium]
MKVADHMRNNGSEFRIMNSHESKLIGIMPKGQTPLEKLAHYSKLVSNGMVPYEDCAEEIEGLSYSVCEEADCLLVMEHLSSIITFFEKMENKSEEQSRDLADVYLLTGQLYQFKNLYEESINWFRKAVVVDDQYTVSYHNIALSYIKLGEIEGAIRSLVQEVIFSPGNYYSYLILADLYERTQQFGEAEQCLKQLLERDPDNIQGLHRLIKYYRMINPLTDVQLLVRRLLQIKKTYTTVESLIRIYYLCDLGRFTDAHSFLRSWELSSSRDPSLHLATAYILEKTSNIPQMNQEIGRFKNLIQKRGVETMRLKVKEFESIVGNTSKIPGNVFENPSHYIGN